MTTEYLPEPGGLWWRRAALPAAAGLAVLALVLALAPGATSAETTHPAAAKALATRVPGPYGTPLTLANGVPLHGYDVAIGADGTAYLGWIGEASQPAGRMVFLCVLPLKASECSGGIQSMGSSGASSANGLQVVANPSGPPASLLWFVDTAESVNGPFNSKVLRADVTAGGALTLAQVIYSSAPSFGSLATAEVGPGGSIWTVLSRPSGTGMVVVNHGVASWAPPIPWYFHKARLAFAGSTPLLVIDKAGAVTEPLRVSYLDGSDWTTFKKVPRTWNVGGAFDVVRAKGGVRLVAPIDNANYYPTVRTWTGTIFGGFTYTGDRSSCHPRSHDLVTDGSGRIADVSLECSKVTVANHPQRTRAALVRFDVGGTPAGGDPQIVTTARGYGVVVWSRLAATTGHRLLATNVRLPALTTKQTARSGAGKVTVTGPVSCMPVSTVGIGVKAKPASGWRLRSKSLKLDGGSAGSTLNGAGLGPGSKHQLVGKGVFVKDGRRVTVTRDLTFIACPNG